MFGNVVYVGEPEILTLNEVNWSTSGTPTASIMNNAIKVTAGLINDGILYVVIDDGTYVGSNRFLEPFRNL